MNSLSIQCPLVLLRDQPKKEPPNPDIVVIIVVVCWPFVFCVAIPMLACWQFAIHSSVPGMSDVGRVVDSGTAGIPSHLVAVHRNELGL